MSRSLRRDPATGFIHALWDDKEGNIYYSCYMCHRWSDPARVKWVAIKNKEYKPTYYNPE